MQQNSLTAKLSPLYLRWSLATSFSVSSPFLSSSLSGYNRGANVSLFDSSKSVLSVLTPIMSRLGINNKSTYSDSPMFKESDFLVLMAEIKATVSALGSHTDLPLSRCISFLKYQPLIENPSLIEKQAIRYKEDLSHIRNLVKSVHTPNGFVGLSHRIAKSYARTSHVVKLYAEFIRSISGRCLIAELVPDMYADNTFQLITNFSDFPVNQAYVDDALAALAEFKDLMQKAGYIII